MHYLELTLPTIEANLALDEALLLTAEAGGPEVLRIWELPTPAVVLGAACTLADDVDEAACRANGVPIARRASGGGSVLLGPGCLLFSLILNYGRASELRDVTSSYRFILGKLRDAFSQAGGIRPAGTSDLALDDCKFSGNAQQRKREHLLHHGSILYAFDSTGMDRYLRLPRRQPEYRNQRGHGEFLANLPMPRAEVVGKLRASWHGDTLLPDPPFNLVQQLTVEKYSQSEWLRRR